MMHASQSTCMLPAECLHHCPAAAAAAAAATAVSAAAATAAAAAVEHDRG